MLWANAQNRSAPDSASTPSTAAEMPGRVADLVPAWVSYLGRDRRYRYANRHYRDQFGLSHDEIVGLHVRDVIGKQAYKVAKPKLDKALLGQSLMFENRIPTQRMGHRDIQVELIPDIVDGQVTGVVTYVIDITDRKRTEVALEQRSEEWERRFEQKTEELRQSEQRFRRIFEDGHFGMALAEPAGRLIAVNEAYCKMLGYTQSELTTLGVADITHPDDTASSLDNIKRIIRGELDCVQTEKRYVKKSGQTVWVKLTLTPVRGRDGVPRYTIGLVEDITERLYAEQALRDSEQRFREVFEKSPLGMSISLQGGPLTHVNASMCRILGYSREELQELTMRDLTHPDDLAKSLECIDQTYKGTIRNSTLEKRYINKSGEIVWARTIHSPVRDDDGLIQYCIAIVEDITEAKRTADELHAANERMHAFLENTPDGILMKDLDGRITSINRVHEQWHGGAAGELIGKTAFDLYPVDIAERISAEDQAVLDTNGVVSREEELRFHDGMVRHVEQRKFPIRDSDDNIIAIGSINRDVTEQRQAERELRSAQRMEAVGQLTGGVAHDFNNLLSVIIGSLELVQGPKNGDTDREPLIDRAVRAADKGAALVQRLLAFSRAQKLEPRVVELDATIESMKDMLRHSLSEAVAIEVISTADLWTCKVDPGQLENTILNLANNAADAMPGGGIFRIETKNVVVDRKRAKRSGIEAGDYVCLRVSDTGNGMTAETVSRMFEPFFTTKEVGQGTGLGLAMVHGFVTQSGGYINVDSAPGKGTSITVYLPRVEPDPVPCAEQDIEPSISKGAGQTVLVIEDDPMVRELVLSQIDDLGYKTLQAGDGPQALSIVDGPQHIDLVLTDIVLPNGLNGYQIADRIRAQRPKINILFMSGYSDEALADDVGADVHESLLQKPFRTAQLAQAISSALHVS